MQKLYSFFAQFGQSCQQGAITTGIHYISKATRRPVENDYYTSRSCADDTICAGQTFHLLIHLSGRVVDVWGLHNDLGVMSVVPIAHVRRNRI